MSLQNVDMKSQRGEKRAAKASGLSAHDEMIEMGKMQPTEHRQQQQQKRRNPGETQQIKIAQAHLRKRSPTPQCDRCNQESRNYKKHLHTELPIPDKKVNELRRKEFGVNHIRAEQPDVDVIHQYEEDREPAQQIDSVEAFLAAGKRYGVD